MKFDFSQPIKLENERIILCPLEQNDFTYLLPFSENEKDLWDFSLTPAAGAETYKIISTQPLLSKKNYSHTPLWFSTNKLTKLRAVLVLMIFKLRIMY